MRMNVVVGAVAVVAVIGAVQHYGAPASAAQSPANGARVPVADEYYLVKTDWIGRDRSIHTIKHGATGSCYILVYPSGQTLQPVEKDRCSAPAAALEK